MTGKCKLKILDEVNVKLEGLDVEIRRKISNKLKYEVPYARHTPQFKLGRWNGKVGFFGIDGNGFVNHLDKITEILQQNNIEIEDIEDHRESVDLTFDKIDHDFWADKTWPEGHRFEGQPIKLDDHQVEAANKFLENPQAIQKISTGAGKTVLTAALAKKAESVGRVLVIVPNKSLVVNTEKDFRNCDLDVGVYYGDRKELEKTHTVCTWQSLEALDKKNKYQGHELSLAEFLEGVKAVIVDEAHQGKAEVLKKILTTNVKNAPIRWGLTGTVPREDFNFEAIHAGIGPVVNEVSARELQEKGFLSNCHINVCQLIDTKEFRDYQSELKYLVTDPKRMEFIGEMVNQIKESGNTLVLVDRIPSGELLHKAIPGSVFISGEVETTKRQDQYDEVNDASNKVIIATYGVASVGIDIPRIFNLVLLEPGKSFIRVVQSIGRGVRKANDKDFVQIWDVTSTCKYAKRHLTQRKKYYKEEEFPFKVEKIDWESVK